MNLTIWCIVLGFNLLLFTNWMTSKVTFWRHFEITWLVIDNSMSWYLPVFSVWFLIRIFLANTIWRKIVKSHAWSIWFITLWKYQFSWSSKSVYLISTIHVTISYSLISNIKMLSPGIPNSVIMPSIDRR